MWEIKKNHSQYANGILLFNYLKHKWLLAFCALVIPYVLQTSEQRTKRGCEISDDVLRWRELGVNEKDTMALFLLDQIVKQLVANAHAIKQGDSDRIVNQVLELLNVIDTEKTSLCPVVQVRVAVLHQKIKALNDVSCQKAQMQASFDCID